MQGSIASIQYAASAPVALPTEAQKPAPRAASSPKAASKTEGFIPQKSPWLMGSALGAILFGGWLLYRGRHATDVQQAQGFFNASRRIPQLPSGGLGLPDLLNRAQVGGVNALRITQSWIANQHKWERTSTDILQWVSNLKVITATKTGLQDVLLGGMIKPKALALPAVPSNDASRWERFSVGWGKHIRLPFQRVFGLDFNPETEIFRPLDIKLKRPDTPHEWNPLDWRALDVLRNRFSVFKDELSTEALFNKRLLSTLQAYQKNNPSQNGNTDALVEQLLNDVRSYGVELRETFKPSRILTKPFLDAFDALHDAKTGRPINPKSGKDFTPRGEEMRTFLRLSLQKYRHLGHQASDQRVNEIYNGSLMESALYQESTHELLNIHVKEWLRSLKNEWESQSDATNARMEALFKEAFTAAASELKATPTADAISVFGKHLAPLRSWDAQHKQVTGPLSEVLEPHYQLAQRHQDVTTLQNNVTKVMVMQTAFQALMMSLVIGNAVTFVVFNSFARLDPDFDSSKDSTIHWNLKPIRKWWEETEASINRRLGRTDLKPAPSANETGGDSDHA